jgi:hypothetical protein
MSDTFRFQGRRLLMQRIGPINPTRQRDGAPIFDREATRVRLRRKNPRAPESRGLWAFPYPLFDRYFASFQRELALPKHLLKLRQQLYKEDCTDEEIDKYDEEYAAWSKLESTRARLRVRQFWVSGEIYTHVGSDASEGSWRLMPVTEFARSLRKQYAQDLASIRRFDTSTSGGELQRLPEQQHRDHRGAWPLSVDHLEVFLGRDAKIH